MSRCSSHETALHTARPPTAHTRVYKDECVLCFATSDAPAGLLVCLACFQGGCAEHAGLHFQKTGHPLAVRLQRHAVAREAGGAADRVVVDETEPASRYEWELQCLDCGELWDPSQCPPHVGAIAEALVQSPSAQKRMEMQAWSEQPVPCEHALSLRQERSSAVLASHCALCDRRENLWLCLACGSLGCGRRQFDGSGGNGHAMAHYGATGHGVCCKLGTISPEGSADVYCYACDEMRVDPGLQQHLATFGVSIAGLAKTEKSMAELQLARNLAFDFSMATDDGQSFPAVTGHGCIGLGNLGNSCYMAAVLQASLHLPQFRGRYSGPDHVLGCRRDAPLCLACQLAKVTTALFPEGEPAVAGGDGAQAKGPAPWMFKAVVSSGHADFASARQQDAADFMAHLLKTIQLSDPSSPVVRAFQFAQLQTIACNGCGLTRSSRQRLDGLSLLIPADATSLDDCLRAYFAAEPVQWTCPRCGKQDARKHFALLDTPEVLVLQMARFVEENHVPRKLEAPVDVGTGALSLAPYVAVESEGGEAAGVEGVEEQERGEAAVDESSLQQLASMGFVESRGRLALRAVGGRDVEAAMNWLIERMDLADEALVPPPGPAADEDRVRPLVEAGFGREQAAKALESCDGDVGRAMDWLLSRPATPLGPASPAATTTGGALYGLQSFVSHKGPSIHCGHYVAHHWDGQRWLLFNDQKVVQVPPEAVPTGQAYLYFYHRRH